jgi:glycerol-3-phosphate acyltransferase PlsY
MLMVWVAQLVGLNVAAQVTVGLAAILGHNWSVFLRFSGGRGILTTLGVALILPAINSLVPWGIAAFLVIAAISSFGFHNVPLGVGAGIAALPVVSYGVSEPLPITLGCLAMFAIMVIKRLAVRRAAIAASLSRRELLINRLLFDRDIRDREAWIYHTRHKARSAEEQRDQKKGQPQ